LTPPGIAALRATGVPLAGAIADNEHLFMRDCE
jgi:hypothetical protein